MLKHYLYELYALFINFGSTQTHNYSDSHSYAPEEKKGYRGKLKRKSLCTVIFPTF